jgi:hypothetical protein
MVVGDHDANPPSLYRRFRFRAALNNRTSRHPSHIIGSEPPKVQSGSAE